MRSTSEYHITCDACNAPIVSVTREAKCEKCGVAVRVDWPIRSTHLKTL